ncbi:zeta toxin family protein [Eisenbergiella porci]|uniref:zeta toxin family protein n=1 Tax=Eisenbergiella porci TaxID=2652274 RepID=UPI0023F10B29|nr:MULTISPECIES: zeta toxin family protein [Eisenbergiella]MDY5527994.1 zeta toxin family protein [Eisenbergiella porci]
MMKKLVILRGNSGSGKTIVAKKLQEKFGPNTMRLSHDMIRMEVLHVWGIYQDVMA